MLEGSRNATQRPALVVDGDSHFLQSLIEDPASKKLPPIIAHGGPQAQLILADSNQALAGTFVNLNLPNDFGLSVIRFAHQYRPTLPIFLLHDEAKSPLSPDQLKQLAIQQALPKPVTYTQIMKLIAPPVFTFDVQEVASKNAESKETVGATVKEADSEFVPIRAENFLAGGKNYFNIYVRLASGKYVKILHAGDDFSVDRIEQFVKKGVQHFFLRKDTQEQYLTYCDQLASELLKNKKAPLRVRATQTLNHGEETMSFLKTQGISQAHLQHAADFVRNVKEMVKQLEPNSNTMLKAFLQDVASYEHGVAVTTLASLMLPALSFDSEKSVQIVGMAALLHDIGLMELPEHLRAEDETTMSESDRILYETHPDRGADIVRKIRGLEPAVSQAVAQHHERRKRRGFPNRMGATSINRVAEIVGICDEFSRLLVRSKATPEFDPLYEMDLNVFQGFSFPVVDVFRKVFMVHNYRT